MYKFLQLIVTNFLKKISLKTREKFEKLYESITEQSDDLKIIKLDITVNWLFNYFNITVSPEFIWNYPKSS